MNKRLPHSSGLSPAMIFALCWQNYNPERPLPQPEKIRHRNSGLLHLATSTFILEMGVSRFEVDMTGYQPGRLRKARPDRAQALRLTRTKMQQQPFNFLSQ
jgi:hypothetical protein